MKNKTLAFFAMVAALVSALFSSCEDDTSVIGPSIGGDEVAIYVDSLFTVTGESVYKPEFDPRATSSLLGRISVPEYGNLNCTFMSQMMSSSSLGIPDSLGVERVDSMKLILRVPRGALTGDSLAPQQLRVYQLTKPLKAVDGKFDPKDYISEASQLGSRSFTLSALSMNDSLFTHSKNVDISIPMSKDFARKVFTDYRTDPTVFQWPSSFQEYFPGIYVEPSFGRGCIANISKAMVVMYYYYRKAYSVTKDDVTTTEWRHVKDSVTVFSTAPEVVTVNNISLDIADAIQARVAAGEHIILSPSGYNVRINFPLKEIMARYHEKKGAMTVVDDLTFSLPASVIENDFGISVPPNLLMVRTKDMYDFFAKNKAPDGETSFWAAYDSNKGCYTFDSMRTYLNNALADEDGLEESDYEFTLIPVSLVTEQKYVSYNQTETVVTGCTPYVLRPAMAKIHLDRAKVKLSFSQQTIN